MAIQDGYSRYQCDVQSCGNVSYALPDSNGADQYSVRRRIDANGQEVKMTLCAEHKKAYLEKAQKVDAMWAQFTKDGTGDLVTQAELDEAKADLARMTKDRDGWWKRAKDAEAERDAIRAEYDAYRAAHPETTDTTEGGES